MPYTIIDIPGYNHSSSSGWHPQLREYMSRRGYEIQTLDLPGGKYPVFDEWYPIIISAIQQAQYPVVLIGHSLGTRAVLRVIEKSRIMIETIILIAPFDNNPTNALFRDGNYANFFDTELDFDTIGKYIHHQSLVIGSIDDKNIPYIQAQHIAQDLNAELIGIDNSGHFLDAVWANTLGEIIVKKLAV
jgi:predicted alpha/beta hydrolase family esterase